MARTKGMLNLSGNLEVNAGAPLDARSIVPTLADLTVAANFQYKYIGMTVTVQATGDMYTLLSNDVTDIANWKPVGKTYTAGTNVNISDQNVISATDTTYTAGTGIDITNGVISATGGGGSSYTAGDGIVIEDDEISTDNMPAADMSEIVTPLPSVMSRLPVLFDETGTERQVGWYKNSSGLKKPVYEKDFNVDSISQGSWTVVNHNIDNFERAVSIFATGFKSSDSTYWVWNGYRDTGSCGTMVTDATRFQIYTGSGSQLSSAKVTIQYTKTTDTPV